jgi:hypothetical protein
MYLLNPTSDGAYVTPDAVYRLERRPDPWLRPEGPLPDTWVVRRATYKAGLYHHLAEVESLDAAREVIDADMRGRVFQIDTLDGTGRLACRWCDSFQADVEWTVHYDPTPGTLVAGVAGCRLCIAEINLRTMEASHA